MQLEFDLGERYDIFSDRVLPANTKDIRTYQEVYAAYGRVRLAVTTLRGDPLVTELERVHRVLKDSLA